MTYLFEDELKQINIFKQLCDDKGLKFEEKENGIFILTPFSSWFLDFSGCTIVLRHKNMLLAANKKGASLEGYHIQNNNVKNILSIPNFIINHDDYKINRMPI